METYDEKIKADGFVLVEFYADWCSHCQRMKPVVEDFKKDMEGKVAVYTFEIDRNQEIAEQNDVETIPTFILYKSGVEVWRHSGELIIGDLEGKIREYGMNA